MSLSRTTHSLPGLVVPVDELLSNSARVAAARESKHMRAICLAMVTGPGRGRHLEQPDWVAGTQEVSSTETPHPAGDDLRILRQRSSPSHGRDHGTGRRRPPQSTSLPARTRARRSVETTVPRERAFVVVPDSILRGTMPGCPASTTGVGRNSTARPRSARRRACPMSRCGRAARSSNATERAGADTVMRRDVGARKGVVRSSSRSVDAAVGSA
jgi:hypothetical protein